LDPAEGKGGTVVAKHERKPEAEPHGPEQTRVVWIIVGVLARLFAASVQLYCHFADRQ
jgi:hypothetical protein